ncbi:DUF448 domain-containing protein [Altererythrobacter confluentis]|uniref:DUF448 domain-containing protein n=1 Tax=Allopontixanthobacter confluentis TaxID=1849021 RepID=A0A6L7GGR3_9SPHN|nr:DUF448 domain-containing protein [Allopontixanthobacter confluentis]MXP14705.1 DUF448 domain-containing protein [Allopontixanthobacter confluentis]
MRTPNNERVSPDKADRRKARDSGPERRCILSGDTAPRGGLIRLAISPDGPDGVAQVLPDLLARAPGRGAWLGVSRSELETALAKGKLRGALARAFKGAKLEVPVDLPDRIENGLSRLLLDRLGLEMRSGKLILGSDRIAEQARSGRVALLLHAADASQDGSRKLDQAWRVGRDLEGSGEQGIRLPLDRAALSVALGRDNVVHMALADSGSAERISSVLTRLLHFLGSGTAGTGDGMSAGIDAGMTDGELPAQQTATTI